MRGVKTRCEATVRSAIASPLCGLALASLVLGLAEARAGERPARCEPDGKMRVAVALRPPRGETLAGVKLNLDYPAPVALPGFMDRGEVRARVTEIPAGFLVSPNNTEDGALVVAIAGTSALPSGKLFAVEFDRCKGLAKAKLEDFHCKIEQASTEAGVLVEGATCSVAALGSEATTAKATTKSKSERSKSREGAL